ncbi:MAG TPA: lysine-2,3-aminomutase-like protein [Alphaproteobacteria bacterium]
MKTLLTPHIAALANQEPAVARQFLPEVRETEIAPEENADPIGDGAFTPVHGIVHRYPDRVLLKPVMTCAAYCRFCFRREMVGDGALTGSEMDAAIGYIAAHPEVREVILTGGDPLVLSARRIGALIKRLAAIPRLDWLRVHTRVPIVDPARITPAMIAALKSRLPVYVAIHCNHAAELTPEVRRACARMADAGIPLLAQTVLLKGVNDGPDTLAALMRALVKNRIKPYYLHHADLAPGTTHFRTSIAEGQALMRALRGRVSGLAQPTYVLDIPGGHGKAPIGPCYLDGDRVVDWRGNTHSYAPSVASAESGC